MVPRSAVSHDVVWKLSELVYGQSLEKQVRENLEFYKQGLVGESGSSEDQNADRNVNSKSCVDEVSERNKDSTANQTRFVFHSGK